MHVLVLACRGSSALKEVEEAPVRRDGTALHHVYENANEAGAMEKNKKMVSNTSRSTVAVVDVWQWESHTADLQKQESLTNSYMKDLMANGMQRHVVRYERHAGWVCRNDASVPAQKVATDLSSEECQARCDKDLRCSCFQHDRGSGACLMQSRTSCVRKNCKRSQKVSVFIQKAVWGRSADELKRYHGRNCVAQGSEVIDHANMPMSDLSGCQARCGEDKDCTCFTWNRLSNTCQKLKSCSPTDCKDSPSHDTYLHLAAYNGYETKYAGIQY